MIKERAESGTNKNKEILKEIQKVNTRITYRRKIVDLTEGK